MGIKIGGSGGGNSREGCVPLSAPEHKEAVRGWMLSATHRGTLTPETLPTFKYCLSFADEQRAEEAKTNGKPAHARLALGLFKASRLRAVACGGVHRDQGVPTPVLRIQRVLTSPRLNARDEGQRLLTALGRWQR